MGLFSNSGDGVSHSEVEMYVTIAKWVGLILFMATLVFFHVIWNFL